MLSDEDIIATWPAQLADREQLAWKGRHLKANEVFLARHRACWSIAR